MGWNGTDELEEEEEWLRENQASMQKIFLEGAKGVVSCATILKT